MHKWPNVKKNQIKLTSLIEPFFDLIFLAVWVNVWLLASTWDGVANPGTESFPLSFPFTLKRESWVEEEEEGTVSSFLVGGSLLLVVYLLCIWSPVKSCRERSTATAEKRRIKPVTKSGMMKRNQGKSQGQDLDGGTGLFLPLREILLYFGSCSCYFSADSS